MYICRNIYYFDFMKTTTTIDSGILTIAISGQIDSTQALSFEDEIFSIIKNYEGDMQEIILDIENLTYISSSGLRIILTVKKRYPNFTIVNCSNEIYNVFDMTGFTEILDIKKALPQVPIDGIEKVDGLKDTYQLTDETMLKVFPEGTTKADVEHEVQLSRHMFVLGVPSAMTFDIVKVGKRFGLIFESVQLKETDATTLGTMMRELHEHIVEPGGLIPSILDKEKKMIQEKAEELGDDIVAKLNQLMKLIPAGSSLLHGDFSAKKIAYQNGAPILIDMSGVSYGNPIIDLAHLYSSLPKELRGDFFDEFLESYYESESDETIEFNRQNITTLALAKEYDKEYISTHWDEILSKLHFKMDFAEEMRKLERKKFFLDGDVNIDWVASTLATNRHYVSDYFNKVLHTTFNDYINNLRLEYALELMRTGKVAPAEIAYEAGFNNDHTFRRLFKEKYGCTPSQYKA